MWNRHLSHRNLNLSQAILAHLQEAEVSRQAQSRPDKPSLDQTNPRHESEPHWDPQSHSSPCADCDWYRQDFMGFFF